MKRKYKKKTPNQKVEHNLDKSWSILVKLIAGMKCEYCGDTRQLNSHHIYGRGNRSTRWDVDNGICLCVSHHTFSNNFSAHQTPIRFTDWLTAKVGIKFITKLNAKAHKTEKRSLDEKKELLKQLQDKIKSYD